MSNNIIDFVIKFNEQGLASVTRDTNSLLSTVNKTIGMTETKSKFATQSINALNSQLDNLKKRRDLSIDTRQITAANREITALEHKVNNLSGHGSGGSGGLAGWMKGGLMAGGVMAAAYAAKKVAFDGIEAAMSYGTRVKSFEVLMGSADKGRNMANSLRDMKMNTLVGGGVYQNAQTLLGFGVNENTIVKKIREIGDVGMGDTDKMSSLTLARAQTTAAGKLMGQDLLQYVNAGFNPLQVMSEKWKEFGFTGKKTIGDLKSLMEDGGITSGMVDKAFTLATGKGGRFHNMMEQIGGTAGGQFLKMKGSWAATQIDIGNSLMPVATSAMEAASGLMHFMNISKTVPESLRSEKAEVNTLVDSISHLNQGNEIRAKLIDNLKSKYSDIFGSLDTEKVKNEDLLKMLDKVNVSYERRINLSSLDIALQQKKGNVSDLIDYASKAAAVKSGYDLGNWDRIKMTFSGQMPISDYFKYFNDDKGFYNQYAKNANSSLPNAQRELHIAEINSKGGNIESFLDEVQGMSGNPKGLHELWGKNYGKNIVTWNAELAKLKKLQSGGLTNIANGSFLNYDYSKLEGLLHPNGSGSEDELRKQLEESGKRIAGGGGRQIVINLNAPMIKDQTFNVSSMAEAKQYSRRDQEEIWASIIHSIKQAL
ncbi:hypothetical protein CJD36_008235 [Flavipsychrobacter stenotrophus]|uniref:Tape measure protein N-terminal domain-containing protein n=1 Tax=Flavipsychrobacter stenotrophus TaxID=2077091 RepID=A0A2S7SXW5_9BACT|nr:tape measure protein [Flavipsychrobacter stenotrophus]PQJ11773.1 hypothetical protein CJD36_008235 [Flavipsychrobacter stenotrophus]